MPGPQNRDALQRAVASFNTKENREGYFALYDSRLRLHGMGTPAPLDLEATKQFYHGL